MAAQVHYETFVAPQACTAAQVREHQARLKRQGKALELVLGTRHLLQAARELPIEKLTRAHLAADCHMIEAAPRVVIKHRGRALCVKDQLMPKARGPIH